MRFTAENIRYCLLAFATWEPQHAEEFVSQKIPLSGLFNWSLVFNGKRFFPRSRDEMAQFNLVHVNITANNLMLLPSMFKLLDRTKTKVIFNVDYALEMWYPHFKFPAIFLEQLDKADYIFSVEEEMAETLSMLLKRPIACIPHPVAVEEISKRKLTSRFPLIGAMHHIYDSNIILPSLAINNAIEQWRPAWRSTAMGGIANDKEVGHLYDNFLDHTPDFERFITYLSNLYAVVESYTLRSYGRVTIECAALGVPVIGSDLVSSQRRCFPLLCTENAQPSKTSVLLKRLIEDKDFWKICAREGQTGAGYYSFEESKKRMLEFLNQ